MHHETFGGNNPLPIETGAAGSSGTRSAPVRNSPDNLPHSDLLQNPKISRPKIPRLVERKTAIRGSGIAPGRAPQSATRKNTLDDLNERDPEVPYVKFEAAHRDLVCSLLERQDRMNEKLFLLINDLQYRMDDVESMTATPDSEEKTGDTAVQR